MDIDPRRIPDLAGRVNYLALAAAAIGGAVLTMAFCLLTAPESRPSEHLVIEHADNVHTDSLLSSYLKEARENRHGRTGR